MQYHGAADLSCRKAYYGTLLHRQKDMENGIVGGSCYVEKRTVFLLYFVYDFIILSLLFKFQNIYLFL